eukprot:1158976-Pelagomonas_calceolata.AAC.3
MHSQQTDCTPQMDAIDWVVLLSFGWALQPAGTATSACPNGYQTTDWCSSHLTVRCIVSLSRVG